MKTNIKSENKLKGFTLIELMIAMVILTFAITGAFVMLDTQSRSYHVQEEVSRIQENARSTM